MVEDMVEDMEIVNISLDMCKKTCLRTRSGPRTRDARGGGDEGREVGFLAELP